jgi:Ser/Thr protein kinase RdoA (MazF antagonist)
MVKSYMSEKIFEKVSEDPQVREFVRRTAMAYHEIFRMSEEEEDHLEVLRVLTNMLASKLSWMMVRIDPDKRMAFEGKVIDYLIKEIDHMVAEEEREGQEAGMTH